MRRALRSRVSRVVALVSAGAMTGCLSYIVANFMLTYEETTQLWGAPGPGEGRIVMMSRVDHAGRIVEGMPVHEFTFGGRPCRIRDGAFHYTDRLAGDYFFAGGGVRLVVDLAEGETEYVGVAPNGAVAALPESEALALLEDVRFHPPETFERDPKDWSHGYCGDYWE